MIQSGLLRITMGLRSMPLWDLGLIPHIPHGSTNPPTLSLRKPRGKWLSQALARCSGAVVPALRQKELRRLGVILLRLR